MGFGISLGSAEGAFLPVIKFDARSGDLVLMDKDPSGTGWIDHDITRDQPVFAVDFGSAEVGWMAFSKPPVFMLAPLGKPMPAKPEGEGFKQGIRLKLAGKALGGVRGFSTCSKTALAAFEDLHNAFEGAPEAAQGLIPVVKFTGSKSVKVSTPQGQQTFKAPILEITQWVPRNADMLGPRTVPPPAAVVKAAPVGGAPLPPKAAELDDAIPFGPEVR